MFRQGTVSENTGIMDLSRPSSYNVCELQIVFNTALLHNGIIVLSIVIVYTPIFWFLDTNMAPINSWNLREIASCSAWVGHVMILCRNLSEMKRKSFRTASHAVLSLKLKWSAIDAYLSWLAKYHNSMRILWSSGFCREPPEPTLPKIPLSSPASHSCPTYWTGCSALTLLNRKNVLNSSKWNFVMTF